VATVTATAAAAVSAVVQAERSKLNTAQQAPPSRSAAAKRIGA